MLNWLKKLFGFAKRFVVRAGLDAFLKRYENIAIEIVKNLFTVNSNQSFHEWKDQAFDQLKSRAALDKKEIADNWVSLAISLAFETVKSSMEKK